MIKDTANVFAVAAAPTTFMVSGELVVSVIIGLAGLGIAYYFNSRSLKEQKSHNAKVLEKIGVNK